MELLHEDAHRIDVADVMTRFNRDGYARLGRVASDAVIEAMRGRSDDIMLGRVQHEGLFFQLDNETGRYEELVYGRGWEGPSLNYRKIEKVERDAVFLAWIENPLFEKIARARIAGDLAIYRAVIMSKRAQGGTHLPWHQDGGAFWGLDKDPELQIWTALDDAPEEAGCVEIVPGTHDRLATPLGGVVPAEIVSARLGAEPGPMIVPLPAKAGEAVLIHNYAWHRSGVNVTPSPRRALSVCYIPASTKCQRKRRAPRQFHRVFER